MKYENNIECQNDHRDCDSPFGKLYDGFVRYSPRATNKRRKHYGAEQAVAWGACRKTDLSNVNVPTNGV